MGVHSNKRLAEDLNRFRSIERYISEQLAPQQQPLPEPELPLPEPQQAEPSPEAPMPQENPLTNEPQMLEPIELNTEDGGGQEETTEELEITDLVRNQEEIKEKQSDNFKVMMDRIDMMAKKLEEIDHIMSKLDGIEEKQEKYRPRTPEERLELRSLDSGPYKQNLRQYFDEKLPEMEESGKEYVITTDDATNFSPEEIKNSFSDPSDVDDFSMRDFNSTKRFR